MTAINALDDVLWEPSALGTIGPRGLLTKANGELLYAALYDYDSLSDEGPRFYELGGRVTLKSGPDAVQALARLEPERSSYMTRHPGAEERALGALATLPDQTDVVTAVFAAPWDDDRVAEIHYMWVAPEMRPSSADRGREIVVRTWRALVPALAKAGFVAMVTRVPDLSIRSWIVGLGGFRPVREVLVERGLLEGGAQRIPRQNDETHDPTTALFVRLNVVDRPQVPAGFHYYLEIRTDGSIRRRDDGPSYAPLVRATSELLRAWSGKRAGDVLSVAPVIAAVQSGDLEISQDDGRVGSFFWRNEANLLNSNYLVPDLS